MPPRRPAFIVILCALTIILGIAAGALIASAGDAPLIRKKAVPA
jgi:hypothetical protein